jgi:hypothetical protein
LLKKAADLFASGLDFIAAGVQAAGQTKILAFGWTVKLGNPNITVAVKTGADGPGADAAGNIIRRRRTPPPPPGVRGRRGPPKEAKRTPMCGGRRGMPKKIMANVLPDGPRKATLDDIIFFCDNYEGNRTFATCWDEFDMRENATCGLQDGVLEGEGYTPAGPTDKDILPGYDCYFVCSEDASSASSLLVVPEEEGLDVGAPAPAEPASLLVNPAVTDDDADYEEENTWADEEEEEVSLDSTKHKPHAAFLQARDGNPVNMLGKGAPSAVLTTRLVFGPKGMTKEEEEKSADFLMRDVNVTAPFFERKLILDLTAGIPEIAKKLADVFLKDANEMVNKVKAHVEPGLKEIGKNATVLVNEATNVDLNKVKDKILADSGSAKGSSGNVFTAAGDGLKKIWEAIKNAAAEAARIIKEKAEQALRWAKEKAEQAARWAADKAKKAVNAIGNFFRGKR